PDNGRPADSTSITRSPLLVLGLQFSLADSHDNSPCRRTELGVHDLCCQRAPGRLRTISGFSMSEHGGKRGGIYPERALLVRRRLRCGFQLSAAFASARSSQRELSCLRFAMSRV